MIKKLVLEAVDQLLGKVKEIGGVYRDFYVGIASDPEKRLFIEHNVDKDRGEWAYIDDLENEEDARDIEKHLISLGFQGGPGGGDDNTAYVYIFKITSSTKQI